MILTIIAVVVWAFVIPFCVHNFRTAHLFNRSTDYFNEATRLFQTGDSAKYVLARTKMAEGHTIQAAARARGLFPKFSRSR